MSSERHVDIRIESTDPSVVELVETTLKPLKPARQEPHRDLITILTVAAAGVKLVKSLIDLWKVLRTLRSAPPVKIETQTGAQLNLTAAKSEDEIQKFVAQSGG